MRLFRNQRGQMAIFIALIFQVLFVLFAMSINVALIVHDKINLQNAVDLAAYYAAQKQAEMLNAIAHNNYQIRQAWKLLSWRYRVLGTLGLEKGGYKHPARNNELIEDAYSQAVTPYVCVTYKPNWVEVPPDENLCNSPGLKIPPLPKVEVIAGFLGINHAIAALSKELISSFDKQCDTHGAYNWWFSMSIMHAFRVEQRNRKLLIQALAANLTSKTSFVDLNGESVESGARTTYEKNLTYANRTSQTEFEMLNSMEGVPTETWLPEIQIHPTIMYVDVTSDPGCNQQVKPITDLPQRTGALQRLRDPSRLNSSDLEPWAQGEPPVTDPYHMSLGVEKNPWYMAYVGVKASTAPRQIFFPIGPNVVLTARAFAQPFGGRIGPWHGSTWPLNSSRSIGPQTDKLAPSRTQANGLLDSEQDPNRLPNYSRFPGDKLGMISRLSQAGLKDLAGLGMSFDYYRNLKADFTMGNENDKLAWDYKKNEAPKLRAYELAIVSPDLFDITYYSIEPNYMEHYYSRFLSARTQLKIPSDLPIRPDMGWHSPKIPIYSVQNQMEESQKLGLQQPEAFFFVRSKENLLTAWAPGDGAVNYGFPDKFFGKCQIKDDDFKIKNPGSCIAGGGRTGYSVRILARDYLRSPLHQVGGNGASGPIANPPPDGW